jgi:UDP-N-acetylmuramoyl-tripeptide--D-alanyl-D-alanine ligase
MEQNWTLATILNAVGVPRPERFNHIPISSIQTNPQHCSEGSLFIADPFVLGLLGYERLRPALMDAVASGASAVVTTLSKSLFQPTIPVLRVKNIYAFIAKLTVFARQDFAGRVIAITGSVGKATTKDVVANALSQFGTTHKTLGTENSIGFLCKTIMNAPKTSDFLVLEIGSTESGHIDRIRFSPPEIGIVTYVTKSRHRKIYGGDSEILKEKLSLFDHLTGAKIAITHETVVEQDRQERNLLADKDINRLITVGLSDHNDIYCTDIRFDGVKSQGVMHVFGARYPFRLDLPAPHFVNNAMYAAATASVLDLSVEKAIGSLTDLTLTKRRIERSRVRLKNGDFEFIDDSYNNGADSTRALLKALSYRKAPRKVFIWSFMGGYDERAADVHAAIAAEIYAIGINSLIFVGDKAKEVCDAHRFPEVTNFPDWPSLALEISNLVKADDLVVLKNRDLKNLTDMSEVIKNLGDCYPAGQWRIEDNQA